MKKVESFSARTYHINEFQVGKVSKPCRPLCAWLKAVDNYTQVLRNVEPKKAK